MAQGDWWFDLKTHQVVSDNNDTKVTDRLGPYKTREDAVRALERVEERNEEYDNDPRWNDDR
jgi:cell division protein FtsN